MIQFSSISSPFQSLLSQIKFISALKFITTVGIQFRFIPDIFQLFLSRIKLI